MPVAKAQLEARFAQCTVEHADLWRKISMSDEWRKLQALEGKLELLTTLIKEYEDAPADDPR